MTVYLDPDEGTHSLSPYTLSNQTEFKARYLAEIVAWQRFVRKVDEKIIDELLDKESLLERRGYPYYVSELQDHYKDIVMFQRDPMTFINDMIGLAKEYPSVFRVTYLDI